MIHYRLTITDTQYILYHRCLFFWWEIKRFEGHCPVRRLESKFGTLEIMKTIKIRHFKFAPLIGVGYWYDKYTITPEGGYCHNIVLPFIRIQWGEIYFKP